MSIPRRGIRPVTLDGKAYEWSIRRKPTYSQAAFETSMTLAVQSADLTEKCVLLVNLQVSRPDNWMSPHQTAITPAKVRAAIHKALLEGWDPAATESPFRIDFGVIRDSP